MTEPELEFRAQRTMSTIDELIEPMEVLHCIKCPCRVRRLKKRANNGIRFEAMREHESGQQQA